MLKPNETVKDKNTGDFVDVSNTEKQKVEKKPAKKKNNGKVGFFKRFGNKCKDIFSELKKVSWPSFSDVVKKTGIVLVVVLAFLIVITAFDYGLTELLGLIQK